MQATSRDESCGRYALMILLVLPLRVRRAVFEALQEIGEL